MLLEQSLEAAEKWITIKIGLLTSIAVSGAGMASAVDWLAILGAIAALITALAGLARIVREMYEIRRSKLAEERARREEARRINLDLVQLRGRISRDSEQEQDK